jgi:hypothetical protein
MGNQHKTSSTRSKIHVEDLKDGLVIIHFTNYGMTHVFQTLDLALNEYIQQGLSPTISG